MTSTAPILHRKHPGYYTSMVRPRGAGGEPFEITVEGPTEPNKASRGIFHQWMVTSDDERFFDTLSAARTYLACFFERA